MKKIVTMLLLSLVIITFMSSFFLFRDQVVLYSRLYKIKNIDCQENYTVDINPGSYYGLCGEKSINRTIATIFDTTIKLQKISIDPEKGRVNLSIKLDNRWDIVQGKCLVLYKVEGLGRSRSFTYDEVDFFLIDSSGERVSYLQYGLSSDTIIITFDKEMFFNHKGDNTLKFSLNKYIQYSLWFL